MSSHQSFLSMRVNVLTLDGGGVRGLSTLLILKRLMEYINQSIREQSPPGTKHAQDVAPHHIFDLVAGTSTGGLIAIMLGKLGMTVDQCIDAYRNLSAKVFGHIHFGARFTGGLAPARYSASNMQHCVQELVELHRGDKDLLMAVHERDVIACTVICREHENKSRHSGYKTEPVCICTLPCSKEFQCRVFEAARATSAAPTFFPVQQIGSRYFADGGLRYNNPTQEILRHYTRSTSVQVSKRSSVATENEVVEGSSNHNNLDCSRVRFVNLGTGTVPEDLTVFRDQGRSTIFKKFIPGAVRMVIFLKKELTKIATDAENVAESMKTIARISSGGPFSIDYERFSEDNGVCFIKMNKYKRLADIEVLTNLYLDREDTTRSMQSVAHSIAKDYLARPLKASQNEANDLLTVSITLERAKPQALISQHSDVSTQGSDIQTTGRESQEISGADTESTQSDYHSPPNGVKGVGTGTASIDSSPKQPVSRNDDLVSQANVMDLSV